LRPVETKKSRHLSRGLPPGDQERWRWQIENLIRTPEELGRFFDGSMPGTLSSCGDARAFKMSVTPYYAGLIEPGRPDDPILRQVLPLPAEADRGTGCSADPLAEEAHSPLQGVVHRYPDRVLLLVTGFCPTLCRFCMRRRAWSMEPSIPDFDVDGALDYIGSHPRIRDVILSGGDPLFAPSSQLEAILAGLKRIPHIRIIRIGTRAPVTLPMRIDRALGNLFKPFGPLWFITHFNHPREVTTEAKNALGILLSAGAVINNQSVLLRGVNDSASILIELSVRLLESGVRPYYLHQVDLVEGVNHFRVPIGEGMGLVKAMVGKVSGLGIPRYVLDLPGGKGKVPLMPEFVLEKSDQGWVFQGPLGGKVVVAEEREPRPRRSLHP
jgi:lysine 2,3-aminomutase